MLELRVAYRDGSEELYPEHAGFSAPALIGLYLWICQCRDEGCTTPEDCLHYNQPGGNVRPVYAAMVDSAMLYRDGKDVSRAVAEGRLA